MGPNFARFRSTGHGYGDKRQNQKSKMAAGGHLEYDVNMLDIQAFMPHAGPNWALFGSTDHGYGDKCQNQKSKMAAGGHLEYDAQHVRYSSLYAPWVQIGLRSALRTTVTEINAKIRKSKMAAGGRLEYDVSMLDIQAFMPHGSKLGSVRLYGPRLRR